MKNNIEPAEKENCINSYCTTTEVTGFVELENDG